MRKPAVTSPSSPLSSAAPLRDGVFVVPPGIRRKPLDGQLRALLGGASWGDVRRAIETGKVTVNGEVVTKPEQPISSGAHIAVTMAAPRPTTKQRLTRDVIVYEDAHVAVVRKPAGISTVPFDESETGTLDQLVRALLSRERKARGGPPQGSIGVVHRIDKDTTGLLVFARTLAAKKHLTQQFREHTVHRRYSAIVHGAVCGEHTIESYLVADRGDGLRGSTKLRGQGQHAVTHIRELEQLDRSTLIDCRLETGRTHQIRIHLSERGHPLIGERVYVRNFAGEQISAPRMMLHARELGFIHPYHEQEMHFEEPLPDDMATVWRRLGGKLEGPHGATALYEGPAHDEPCRPMAEGYLALVLHTHLPFVRHPEHERPLEERWLHEALSECYLPLLDVFARLERDSVPFALTMSLTPPLVAMLRDDLLRRRFDEHLARLERLAAREQTRLADDALFGPIARFYVKRFAEVRARWEAIGGDVVGALLAHRAKGQLDLITCSATHAYLPGLMPHPRSLRAQLRLGVAAFEQMVGERPLGMWLPECAYHPSFDADVGEAGVRYTVLDAHGLLHATPRPAFDVFHPIVSPGGTAFFARDDGSARQVWSREVGYPGNAYYRDFYRDIGFDEPEEHLLGELGPFGSRVMTGLKYYRITGQTEHKLPYMPGVAEERAHEDARDFVGHRLGHIKHLRATMPVPPVIVAPYDAELFGHWWFEGPLFLEWIFRHAAPAFEANGLLEPITLRRYLERHPQALSATPAASSWGAGGHGEVWVGPAAAPYWRHVHHGCRTVEQLLDRHRRIDGVRGEALDLAIRELLLLQTSDWPFILRTGSMVEYAESRLRAHGSRLARLARLVEAERMQDEDVRWMRELNARDSFLQHMPSETLRAAFD